MHRSDDSGTQDNFTQYLSAVAPDVWTDEADGVWPLKSGEGANGTSGVIESVTNGAGSIGFADESQAGDLGVAKVKVGSEYVAPSAESAAKTVDVSPRVEGRPEGDIAIDVDRKTTESGAYPIVLVSYVIACPSYDDAKTRRRSSRATCPTSSAATARPPPPRQPAPRRCRASSATRPPSRSTRSRPALTRAVPARGPRHPASRR